MSDEGPILQALKAHKVTARVTDLDHYRIHGGMAVETDYIITVSPISSGASADSISFDPFLLSKTYSAFRVFSGQLKKIVDSYTSKQKVLPEDALAVAKYCELISHLTETQRTQYLGKVNYNYVKVLAKQRCAILDDILDATCAFAPRNCQKQGDKTHELVRDVSVVVEHFFLTDHCEPLARKDPTLQPIDDPVIKPSSTGSLNSSGSSAKHKVTRSHGRMFNFDKITNINKTLFGDKKDEKISSSAPFRPYPHSVSIIVPMTRKHRRPDPDGDEKELNAVGEEAKLLLDDDRSPGINYVPSAIPQHSSPALSLRKNFSPSFARPRPVVQTQADTHSKLETFLDNNPIAFLVIFALCILLLHHANQIRVSMNGDLILLFLFASYCMGLHTPRALIPGYDRPATMKATATSIASGREGLNAGQDRSGRRLLRRSMIGHLSPRNTSASIAEEVLSVRGDGAGIGVDPSTQTLAAEFEDEDLDMVLGSPLPKLPDNAAVGSEHTNCWSEPDPADFHVRGPNYLHDKKKVASAEFLFLNRGIDLFLTDTCPENVGSIGAVYGGSLRDKPTFIINFRLPWGVLVFYAEIPERFLPYIKAGYEKDNQAIDKKTLLADLENMTPGDRCACRFLMESDQYKNDNLKIVPIVVDGPWVVRQVVGGKPAIIGTKLPIKYIYQPEEGEKALYLEADLDIAASSAARYVLSVTRSYTDCLTLDLGFVVQGNHDDELPEQMLLGTRIHRLDPLTAPSLPPTKFLFMSNAMTLTTSNSEDDA